jgi:hypothetical protein
LVFCENYDICDLTAVGTPPERVLIKFTKLTPEKNGNHYATWRAPHDLRRDAL